MSKSKILVIEDELDLRDEVTELLRMEGFDVVSAENGEKGLHHALHHNPDLMLCDIMMPIMDGNEVLRRLRENESTLLTPFVFMTAMADRENIRNGMKSGADDYLTKPFSRKELLQAIDSRLHKQKAILQQKDDALNTLRKNIITKLPHELRSPLSGIIGFGSLLKDMAENLSAEDVTDIGKEILDSGNRLLRLIENYMVYVQLEMSEPKNETLSGESIKPIITEAALSIAKKYDREDYLKISLTPTKSLPLSDSFLQKIISELTDNAFRFSPKDSNVTISSEIEYGNYTLTVCDKGRGLTKDQLNQIGAYMQFDRDKLEQQGSGLGLIIAKKMVELSGGKFIVTSEKENGTTISAVFDVF